MKQLLILLFIGLFTIVFASIGKITSLQGDISIKRGSATLKAVKGQEIEVKDTVITKGVAKVKLRLNDGTIIHLGKNAVFSVADYYYEEGKKPTARFSIVNGAFKSISGDIGKIAPEKFKIKTRTATIGIRGTVIVGIITPMEEKIGCTKGAITVKNPLGMVEFKAGNFTELKPGKAPTAPKILSTEFLQEIDDDTFSDKKDIDGKNEDANHDLENSSKDNLSNDKIKKILKNKNDDFIDDDYYDSWGNWKKEHKI